MMLKNLLFPTDLSADSNNAIEYGIHLANTVNAEYILLLHVYIANSPIANQPIISSALPNILQDKQYELEKLKEKVQSKVAQNVKVSTLLLEGKIIPIIQELIIGKQIDLIVMGISTKTKLEQTIIGSNTINVLRKTTCPVIVVPEKATWIENPTIAAAIDISHNVALIPFDKAKWIFTQLKPSKVLLLNIDDHEDHNVHIQNPNIDLINFEFGDMKSKLEILVHPNKFQAIESFCSNKAVSLLVLLERKYNVLDTIFHKSLTTQLAFQAHKPILVLEENIKA